MVKRVAGQDRNYSFGDCLGAFSVGKSDKKAVTTFLPYQKILFRFG